MLGVLVCSEGELCVPDDCLSLGNVVALLVGSRVSVGVGNGREARVDGVRLGGVHQVCSDNG